MNVHLELFLFIIIVFVFGAGTLLGYGLYRSRQALQLSWKTLLTQLREVNSASIEKIARDTIDENGEPRTDTNARALKAEEIWNLIGGLEGLEIIEQNSRVLLEIASYVYRWHPDAAHIAEDLRTKARQIEWHINHLRSAERAGKLEGWFANYAQQAISLYYLMTQQVLHLYKSGPSSMLSEIQQAF